MSGGGGGGGMGQMITNIASSVANVGAGWFASHNLNKGIGAAKDSQYEANALYRDLYGQTQGDYKPYQEAGTSALDALMRTYGLGEGQNGQADLSGFEGSADYLFAREQGEQGANRQAAASGRLYSGAQMKALSRYNQGLATQHLGNYRQGLGTISNQGLNATNALANYRAGYGNQLGQGMTNIGDLELARRLGRSDINYRNVAAQDSIWGSGAGQQGGGGGGGFGGGYGGGQSSYGSNGYSNAFNSMDTNSLANPNYSTGSNWSWGG